MFRRLSQRGWAAGTQQSCAAYNHIQIGWRVLFHCHATLQNANDETHRISHVSMSQALQAINISKFTSLGLPRRSPTGDAVESIDAKG